MTQNELLPRHITLNSLHSFPNNKIRTTKYTWINFIPLFLFDQFSKPANSYFLLISLLQQIRDLSPTGRWGTLIPLVLSLIVSAIKELVEDTARSKEDESINLRKVLLLHDNEITPVNLESLKVGQVIKVLRDELIPADLILLKSSEPDGLCYLETAAIDGESNLKLRQAHSKTTEIHYDGVNITCDAPNSEIYTFQGSLTTDDHSIMNLSLDQNQFLPRGTFLVNTEWIVGAVVYTGLETKIMQNVKEAPRRKVTKMDLLNNHQNAQIVGILFCLVFILFAGHIYYNREVLLKHEYLRLSRPETTLLFLWSYFSYFITFLLLLNNLVPISLSVTLEIVRALLAHLINNDLDMYDDELQIRSKAQSSNVLDELGRIEYIMTDKTGTLTCNQMNLKNLMIYDNVYEDCLDPSAHLMTSLKTESIAQLKIQHFLELMALCHTVMIDKRTGSFQASSPDELALVKAAKCLGTRFVSRTSEKIKLELINGSVKIYTLKGVIEFNSDRKRMSVILQDDQTGSFFIISKGAESVILPLCRNSVHKAASCVEEFSIEGLRTLCFAFRELSESEFNSWYSQWTTALNTFGSQRQILLDSAAASIERDLDFIGVSGIEDRLQDGVPNAIKTLLDANIKIWILTGDRAETATNTAYLSGLLQPQHNLIKIFSKESFKTATIATPINSSYVLIISGDMFAAILADPQMKSDFMQLASKSRALIACRLSPLQKTHITHYVQRDLQKTTLAIGDGGNDVGMIQAADVGVGINGLEGTQAARSADFSLPKFRFIVKLLLVHGAWSFHRISRVILYIMYKNFIMVLCQFWYAWLNSFSAQSIFGSFFMLLYNSAFSVAPPVIIGLTDQYVTAPELIKHPQLYQFGQKGKFYNFKAFWECIANAIVQSLTLSLLFYFLISNDPVFQKSYPSNLSLSGEIFYFCILITISIKVVLFTNFFTKLMSAALLSALFACFLILWIKSGGILFNSALFPSAIFLLPIAALLRDFMWKFYCRQFRPRAYHIVQEMRAVERKRQKSKLKMSATSSIDNETAPLNKPRK